MPTVLEIFGFRFFFYGGDHEPKHVHVEYGDGEAKINIEPVIELVYNKGLKKKELRKALNTVKLYKADILKKWDEHMNNAKNGED